VQTALPEIWTIVFAPKVVHLGSSTAVRWGSMVAVGRPSAVRDTGIYLGSGSNP
jgi:hypothetical protein